MSDDSKVVVRRDNARFRNRNKLTIVLSRWSATEASTMRKPGAKINAGEVLVQFEHLRCALIDASSIIYMTKAGYFECVAENLELCSPRKVIEETGYRNLKVKPLVTEENERSPDQTLVDCAIRQTWPVITDDLGIIRQLVKRQGRFFNALMMLEFVFFKGILRPNEYSTHLRNLLERAWYTSEIVEFGESVHQLLEERGRCL